MAEKTVFKSLFPGVLIKQKYLIFIAFDIYQIDYRKISRIQIISTINSGSCDQSYMVTMTREIW